MIRAPDAVAALREEFDYPDPIESALREVVEVLRSLDTRAVVLMGSAARGELSWRERERGLEMFSDLELICLVDRRSRAAEARVEARIREIEAAAALDNDFFHIDVLIASRFPSGRDGRGLLWYEAGRCHRVLFGELRPADFGDVRPGRISLGLVNELVIIRLWWMLVYFPAGLLGSGARLRSIRDGEEMMYPQVRNLLDVASIWLPNEGVHEIGYRARSRAVRECWSDLDGSDHLPVDFPLWLEEATRKKLECDLSGDPVEWYLRAVRSYRGLVSFLLGASSRSTRKLADRARDAWSERHPRPRSWRYRLYRAVTTIRQAAAGENGVRWLLRRHDPDGGGLSFLLWMHEAASCRLESSDRDAEAALTRAGESLRRFAPVQLDALPTRTSFERRWHALRHAFVDPFMDHHRKLSSQRTTVRHRMRLEEETIHP